MTRDPHTRYVDTTPSGVELRFYGDALDEVVGEGRFHLEQMAAGHWHVVLGDVHVDLGVPSRSRGRVDASWWVDA